MLRTSRASRQLLRTKCSWAIQPKACDLPEVPKPKNTCGIPSPKPTANEHPWKMMVGRLEDHPASFLGPFAYFQRLRLRPDKFQGMYSHKNPSWQSMRKKKTTLKQVNGQLGPSCWFSFSKDWCFYLPKKVLVLEITLYMTNPNNETIRATFFVGGNKSHSKTWHEKTLSNFGPRSSLMFW